MTPQDIINRIHAVSDSLDAEAAELDRTHGSFDGQRLDEINGARLALWSLALWIHQQRDEEDGSYTLTHAGRRVLELEAENERLQDAQRQSYEDGYEDGYKAGRAGTEPSLETVALAQLKRIEEAAWALIEADADDDDNGCPVCDQQPTGMGLYRSWAKAKRTSALEIGPPTKYLYYPDGRRFGDTRNPAHSRHISRFFWKGEWRPLTYEYAPTGTDRTYVRGTRRAGLLKNEVRNG